VEPKQRVPLGDLRTLNIGAQRRYAEFSSSAGRDLDIAIPKGFPFRHGLCDALLAVLGLLADQIHGILADDLPEEVMELKSKPGTRVVRGNTGNEILDSLIRADHNRELIRAKIDCGFHLKGRASTIRT
jgi:hypothetical protein